MAWTPRFCKTCKRIPHEVHLRCSECFEDLGPKSNERELEAPPVAVPVIGKSGIVAGLILSIPVWGLLYVLYRLAKAVLP